MHNAAKLLFENRFCFVGLVFIKFWIKDAHFVLVFMPKNCSFFVFVKKKKEMAQTVVLAHINPLKKKINNFFAYTFNLFKRFWVFVYTQ